MPILYMEIFLGQYTQLGPTQLRYLSPISHGLGFTLLVTCIIKAIKMSLAMADVIMYFVTSIKPQWLICPAHLNEICWSPDDEGRCAHDCISEDITLSSYIYWRDVYMDGVNLDPGNVDYGVPRLARTATLLVAWLLLFMLIILGKNFKKVLKKNIILIDICLLILLLVVSFVNGGMKQISKIFCFETSSFASPIAWSVALSEMVDLLGIGGAIHILHGSFVSYTKQTGILTIGTMSLIYFTSFSCMIITYGAIGIIIRHSDYGGDNPVEVIFKINRVPAIFTVIPQGLGFVGAAELWSMFYFLVCLLLLINNQIVNIFLLEKCMNDTIPGLVRYRRYIIGISCILLCFIGVIFSAKEIFIIGRHLQTRIVYLLETFNVSLLSIFVFYIYGVQKLVDDIQFMAGSPPTKFWIICWYAAPLPLTALFIYELCFQSLPTSVSFRIVHWLMLGTVVSPIPVMFCVEVFNHLKRHHLSGILQPNERWGPSDPEERHLRHIYNPRREIKSRRRKDTCNHNCLLINKVVSKFIEAEVQLREDHVEMLEDMKYEDDDDLSLAASYSSHASNTSSVS